MTPDTQDLRAAVREALATGQSGTVTILSSLLTVQDALGYIPPEALEEVAALTHTTINDVWGVVSFYTNFRSQPPCLHLVEVCWGPSCHLIGAPAVVKEVLGSLGLKEEGDTADGFATLKYNTCLGACAQAPVISVDHRLVGRVTPEEARRQVLDLRARSAAAIERQPARIES